MTVNGDIIMPTKLKYAFILLSLNIVANLFTQDFLEATIELALLGLLSRGSKTHRIAIRALSALGELLSVSCGLIAFATVLLLLNHPSLAHAELNLGILVVSVACCIFGIGVSIFCYRTLGDPNVVKWMQGRCSEDSPSCAA